MSREAIASCRTTLELIAEVAADPMVKTLAVRGLASLSEIAKREEDRLVADAARKKAARDKAAKERAEREASEDIRGRSVDVRGRPPDVRDRPEPSAGVRKASDSRGVGGRSVERSTAETLSGPRSENGAGGGGRGPTPGVVMSGVVTGPAVTLVHLTLPLPDELRGAAELAGLRDVDRAWAKFCGHYNGQTIDIPGKWQKWSAVERGYEAKERERQAGRAPTNIQPRTERGYRVGNGGKVE